MRDVLCSNCASASFSWVRTYKHDWHQCNDCRTLHRVRRPSYPLDIAPLRALIERTPLRKLFGATLLRVREVVEEEKKFYDMYENAVAAGVIGTKWEPLTGMRLEDFARHGISIAGKTVLEISGGPGFLSKAIQSVAQHVTVTEFSKISVDGMASALGIDAVQFDYNQDEIGQRVTGPFDVILIIYSIGFCNDLKAFVRSLKAVMHDKTIVYVCHSPGTLGLMLRWQFDEYTFTRCWELDTVAKCFAEIGYPERAREDEGSYLYDFQWYDKAGTWAGTILKRLHRVIGGYYRSKALRSEGSINRELIQKNVKQIFGADPL